MNIHPKVAGAALSGAIVVIGVWALSTFAHLEIPADIAAAATVLVSALVGYLIPGATVETA